MGLSGLIESERRRLIEAGLARMEQHGLVWFEGGPDRDPLMFLHGTGDQAGGWCQTAKSFAGEHRLLIPDLPGHGESEPLSGPLKLSAIQHGCESVLNQRTTLVGNSLGGWVALLLAAEHPDKVKRVVLVNGSGISDRTDVPVVPRTREEARRLFDAILGPDLPRPADFILDEVVKIAANGPMARILQEPMDAMMHLMDRRLAEVKAPVSLIWGESDRLLTLAYAERLRAGLPHATLTTIPRCGHMPHKEKPEEFVRELRKVLAE